MDERFEFERLTEFLKTTITKNRFHNDIDLSKSVVGKNWTMGSLIMTNGDWKFDYGDKDPDAFELSYFPNKNESIVLWCHRIDRQYFELKDIDRLVTITPIF